MDSPKVSDFLRKRKNDVSTLFLGWEGGGGRGTDVIFTSVDGACVGIL